MLARDWYYNERRQIGLDSAVASIYDRQDDSDLRARAALSMLGVQRGAREDPGARPQGRDPHPIGRIVEFRLSAGNL